MDLDQFDEIMGVNEHRAPKRIQRRRVAGWRMPAGAVYVGRPSKWGNPFGYRDYTGLARVPAALGEGEWEYEGRISGDGARHDYHHPDGRVSVCHVRYMTRGECVETFERMLTGNLTPSMRASAPGGKFVRNQMTVDDIVRELAGRDLACWCPLGEPCHADVLLRIANEKDR
jgi:hypothetical protein